MQNWFTLIILQAEAWTMYRCYILYQENLNAPTRSHEHIGVQTSSPGTKTAFLRENPVEVLPRKIPFRKMFISTLTRAQQESSGREMFPLPS